MLFTEKNALVLVSCDTQRKQSWEYLMMETRGARKIQEPVRYK